MRQRASSTHGPLHDDQMAHEVEGTVRGGKSTHAEEWADPEPSAEDDPDVDRAPDTTLVGGTPPGMDETDVELRSEFAASLTRAPFPGDRHALLTWAEREHAPSWVIHQLGRLPADSKYENVGEVWRSLGHGAEERRT